MKTVFVTGANGFVGRHVCRRLLDAGWRVRGAYRREASSLPCGVEPFKMGNIEQFADWAPAVQDAEAIVHLVARTHIMNERERDPLARYRAVNVGGTQKLLRACRTAGVKRMIFLSSIKAVGEGADVAYREIDPCRPEDAYGISKREAELLVESSASSGMSFVILRPPLVYGPGVTGNFLRIVRAVRRGIPLPLNGVRNARSMIYVENLADAVANCLTHPAASNSTFHVADAEPISTPRLIELLAQAMGRNPRLFSVPTELLQFGGLLAGKRGEVRRLVGSLTLETDRIRETIGWRPPISSQEGLRRTVAALLGGTSDELDSANIRRAA